MAKSGKGIGPAPIIAIAIISTTFAIFIDHFGITKAIERFVERILK